MISTQIIQERTISSVLNKMNSIIFLGPQDMGDHSSPHIPINLSNICAIIIPPYHCFAIDFTSLSGYSPFPFAYFTFYVSCVLNSPNTLFLLCITNFHCIFLILSIITLFVPIFLKTYSLLICFGHGILRILHFCLKSAILR